jgi:hypothetical protein
MMRKLEMATLFLGFGVTGVGAGYVVEQIRLAWRDQPDHEVRVDVQVPDFDVDVQVPDIDVQVDQACAYQAERVAALPASAGAVLRVRAGSGELAVLGREGLDQVRVVARACTSHEQDLDALQVTLEQVGGDFDLSAHYPEHSSVGVRFGEDHYARLDLAIEVPLAMAADIEDGSGGIDVSGTGDLHIRDSSGELRVVDVRGALDIEDSSGEIEVQSAGGSVTIRDSSGEIRVVDVQGPVEIDDDSGDVDVRDVQGEVRVRDGSGNIEARQVGSLTVEVDGSGDILADQVAGDFAVLADGSGSIRHNGVTGRVDVPVRRNRRGR